MSSPFHIIPPSRPPVPVIISIPHAGTFFPQDILGKLLPGKTAAPDDTDWFVDRLYDFAPELGITTIVAENSRWVVDLNRDPYDRPLYDDGRVITSVVPITDFNGESLYCDSTFYPDAEEIRHRIEHYHRPYFEKLGQLLNKKKQEFGKVLLFDAHSIRKNVPGIQTDPFPDLILGDNNGTSAAALLCNTALEKLHRPEYSLSYNFPFKGGYITRYFGNPDGNVHALQLEMCKTNYMDDTERFYNDVRADNIRRVLRKTLEALIETIEKEEL